MKKKKWYILGAAALVLTAAVFFLLRGNHASGGTYDNLIQNGDFEALDNEGLPLHWYTDAYAYQGYTTFDIGNGMEGNGAHIQNEYGNDARFAQTVSVSPNTLYCLRGWIRADAEGGLGANLSVEGIYVFSASVYQTDGEWQEVTLYGRTGENQRSVTVFVRLGGYSGEATGEAWFDSITLCRVDSVPEGETETIWYVPKLAPAADETASKTGGKWLALGCIGYGAVFALLLRWLRQNADEKKTLSKRGKKALPALTMLAGIVLLGLGVRAIVAAQVPGYDVDIGCFRAWAAQIAQVGPTKFYDAVSFCDYPPGYLWILWLIGGVGQFLGGVTTMMVKWPSIIADLALCVLLFREARKMAGEKEGLALALLYALNPLAIVSGAAWGQIDSLMTLLLVLTVLFSLRRQWKAALPVFVAAMLIKPQALMFGPLGLAALIAHILASWKDPAARKAMLRDVGLGLGISLLTALAIVLPFAWGRSLSWLAALSQGTMNSYNYATVNGCNLFFLLGQNWVGAENAAPWYGALCAWLIGAAPLLLAWYRRRMDKHPLPTISCAVLGGLAAALLLSLIILLALSALTYAALGTCMIVYTVLLFAALYFLGREQNRLPLLGAAMLLMLFSTASMMHERYLFPAVALLLMAYYLIRDKRILWLALGVTITGLLNVGCVLDRNIRIGGSSGHLNAPACGIDSDMAFLEYLSAAGNLLLSGAAVYLSAMRCGAEAMAPAAAEKATETGIHRAAPLPENAPLRKMTGRDWAVMLLCTGLYAVLALTNLGSTKAPQKAWVSSSDQEQVVLDLGQERTFKMLYFGGIHQYDSNFSVDVGSDLETWPETYGASMKIGECFKWKYLSDVVGGSNPAVLTGRYVRITANYVSTTLFETLFRDAQTGEVIPVTLVSDSEGNETAAALIDEQDALEGEPGWFNSTYFDEIYHARTAYEHLHGLPTYETTHPPLGKVLMSFAVAIFGMTPFGWRFAGALAGVLMLPGMYLLGKLLIRKKWGGFGAMMLMALDLMHFTQTRIATIDSFVVLFIIWAVYFMLRWFLLDFFSMKLGKTMVPLGLSGLFMGLAVASKWTGCYAGVGLAVIFFYGLFRRIREITAARDVPEKKRSAHQAAAANGARSLVLTVASCFIFFIAIPLMIYYCSYIPYFAYNGGVTVKKVIEAAVGNYFTTGQMGGMLGYHATPGLGMDHSFYSPWYQWPVIGKPMWYASSGYEPAGMQSTIMAMGNPAVWWTGLLGLLGVCVLWAKRHVTADRQLSLYAEKDDPRYALVLICFLAQFLPWTLVPRGTYIYHYFPSVPFIILATVLCLDTLAQRHEKLARWLLIGLLIAAAVLFVAFFPYASGVMVSQKWLDAMNWFRGWLWY